MQLDEEGYLVDPADWNEQVAEALAREERIILSDEHWAVIRCASTTSSGRLPPMPVMS
jgi:TusE/DsrC/DsvC family sulfur relay protein